MKEKELYFGTSRKKYIYKKITHHPDYIFFKAVNIHRKYRQAKDSDSKFLKIMYSFKANRISSKYNLELYGKFGKNLRIWHGNIIINGDAKIGDNCNFHGNNCIGTDGKSPIPPKIGNNVDIGFGAIIIGNIEIADGVKIGANSVVNKSVLEKNAVVAGVPAKIIKR